MAYILIAESNPTNLALMACLMRGHGHAASKDEFESTVAGVVAGPQSHEPPP